VPRGRLLLSAMSAQEAAAEGPARLSAPTVSLMARGAAGQDRGGGRGRGAGKGRGEDTLSVRGRGGGGGGTLMTTE